MDSELSPGIRGELDFTAVVGDGVSSADLYPVPNILALRKKTES
jgi:hypothetical protein